MRGQLTGGQLERRAGPAKCGQHVELALGQPVLAVDDQQLLREVAGQPVQPSDHPLRPDVEIGSFTGPLPLDPGHPVDSLTHPYTLASMEVILASMEDNSRWALVTAIAPVAWGSTYFVTHEFLPAEHPLWGAVIRALPAGLLLLAVRRTGPRGSWWWRSAVLGALNTGVFFALIYLAAQLLPTSAAATIMATAPVTMMLMAWALLAERPAAAHLVGAGLGIVGVGLMLYTGTAAVDGRGVLASVAAMTLSSLGYVLAKRWGQQVDVLAATSWQLIAGGLLLVPAALLVEGAPPELDLSAVLAFGYVTVLATAVAFAAWFAGLRRLRAGTVGLLGLLNPVTGVLLGTLVAAEPLTARQTAGLVLVLAGVLAGQPTVLARLDAWWRGRPAVTSAPTPCRSA